MSQGASTLKIPQRAYFQTLASCSVLSKASQFYAVALDLPVCALGCSITVCLPLPRPELSQMWHTVCCMQLRTPTTLHLTQLPARLRPAYGRPTGVTEPNQFLPCPVHSYPGHSLVLGAG